MQLPVLQGPNWGASRCPLYVNHLKKKRGRNKKAFCFVLHFICRVETVYKWDAVNSCDDSHSFSFSLTPLSSLLPSLLQAVSGSLGLICGDVRLRWSILFFYISGAIKLVNGIMSICRHWAAPTLKNFVCKTKTSYKTWLQCSWEWECQCSNRRSFFFQCGMFTGLLPAFKQAQECIQEKTGTSRSLTRPNVVLRFFLFQFMNLLAAVIQQSGD